MDDSSSDSSSDSSNVYDKDVVLPSAEAMRKRHINRLRKRIIKDMDEAIENDKPYIYITIYNMSRWLSDTIISECTKLGYDVDYDYKCVTVRWSLKHKDDE